jgi:uncharacterized repeat protein (TIGR01451 family)
VKTITNDNGGTKTVANFPLTATGPTTITGISGAAAIKNATVTAGTYTLTETTQSDYTAGLWTCTNGITVTSSKITLSAGQSTVCTITNDDKAPSLTLDKIVVNDNGGTAHESDWTLTANGGSAGTLSGPGAVGYTDVVSGSTFKAGIYALSETGPAGYAASSWSCVKNGGAPVTGSSVTLGLGDTATCTIHNDDIAPGSAVLTVTKTVNNNHGGTKVFSNFPLFIDGSSVTSGMASTTSTGLHTVSETSDSGYTAIIGGDCVAVGTITLVAGTAKDCTITNNDIAPILHLRKVVVNDNGGTATTTDWTLTATGALASSTNLSGFAPVDSGSDFKADTYILDESGPAGYTASSWSCVGASVTGASIKLGLGDIATCTITNDDVAPVSSGGGGSSYVTPVPPLIDVVKVPAPLALPAGPGPVTYTYTLRNIGTVPVSNVTMVDDTCNPITLISGDTNNDAKLDVNETWISRCSTTLSATHTNTVTATGWANGISAVDIASATVVVGGSIVPPLIHVTKIPKPLALPAGGGMITYTETVTNPGTVSLSDVILTDDKCGPIKYISGDTNGDSKLDVNETWIYTCQAKLTKTTTNTAMASGEANGLTARDFAIATVVVATVAGTTAVPALPNTGLPPGGKGIPWNVVVLSGIFAVSFLFYAIRKKRTV